MELLTGRIYCIINKINGKKYVGQTIKSLAQRLNVHNSKYSRCSRLKSAIKSYGIECFEIIELETVFANSKIELLINLNELEKCYIADLNTVHPNGYNLTTGGDKPVRNKETNDRIAKAHFKQVMCIETGQIWESVSACAKFFNVKAKQVSRVLKGQRKRLKWSYTLAYANTAILRL